MYTIVQPVLSYWRTKPTMTSTRLSWNRRKRERTRSYPSLQHQQFQQHQSFEPKLVYQLSQERTCTSNTTWELHQSSLGREFTEKVRDVPIYNPFSSSLSSLSPKILLLFSLSLPFPFLSSSPCFAFSDSDSEVSLLFCDESCWNDKNKSTKICLSPKSLWAKKVRVITPNLSRKGPKMGYATKTRWGEERGKVR